MWRWKRAIPFSFTNLEHRWLFLFHKCLHQVGNPLPGMLSIEVDATYQTIIMRYENSEFKMIHIFQLQVLIFPSHKSSAGNTTTANVWLHVIGSHGDTSYLYIPRGVTHFSFWSTNIGIVTSLRIGHDNYGNSPNWLIDHIILRNEYTGRVYGWILWDYSHPYLFSTNIYNLRHNIFQF